MIEKDLDESHLEAICKLYAAAFRKSAQRSVFDWKYFQNPFGKAKLRGFFANRHLIAMGAMIPETHLVFGKPHTLHKFTDLMVHPEHQGKGLAKKVIQSLKISNSKNESILSYTLCGKNATPSFLKCGYQFMGEVTNYFKPSAILKAQHWIALNSHRKKHNRVSGPLKYPLKEFRFENPENKISICKNAKLIQWRCEHPRYRYEALTLRNKLGEFGYLIYSLSPSNIVHVLDIGAPTDKMRVSLLRAAEIETLRSNSKALVVPCVRFTPLAKIIRQMHYFRNPLNKGPLRSVINFNVFIDKSYPSPIHEGKNWDLMPFLYDDL